MANNGMVKKAVCLGLMLVCAIFLFLPFITFWGISVSAFSAPLGKFMFFGILALIALNIVPATVKVSAIVNCVISILFEVFAIIILAVNLGQTLGLGKPGAGFFLYMLVGAGWIAMSFVSKRDRLF